MTTSADLAHDIRSAGENRTALPADSAVTALWARLSAYQTLVLAMLLIVVLAALVLPPFLFLLKASIVDSRGGGEWTLANFETVAGSWSAARTRSPSPRAARCSRWSSDG